MLDDYLNNLSKKVWVLHFMWFFKKKIERFLYLFFQKKVYGFQKNSWKSNFICLKLIFFPKFLKFKRFFYFIIIFGTLGKKRKKRHSIFLTLRIFFFQIFWKLRDIFKFFKKIWIFIFWKKGIKKSGFIF